MLYEYSKKHADRPARLLEAILESSEGLFLGTNEQGRKVGRDIRTSPRNIFVSWLFEKGVIGVLAGMALVFSLLTQVKRKQVMSQPKCSFGPV